MSGYRVREEGGGGRECRMKQLSLPPLVLGPKGGLIHPPPVMVKNIILKFLWHRGNQKIISWAFLVEYRGSQELPKTPSKDLVFVRFQFCQIWLYSFIFGIKVIRNVVLNNIDLHNKSSRMHRSPPRSRQKISDSKNSNIWQIWYRYFRFNHRVF